MSSKANTVCVGVVGAGQMGSGIAQVTAAAGLQVRLLDLRQEALGKSLARLRRNLGRLVDKGTLS